MKTRMFLPLVLSLALAAPAQAYLGGDAESAPATNPVRLLEQQIASIRAELEPGGRYGNVPKNDRPAIESQLNLMASLLRGVDSIEDLSKHRKIRLFNAQEKVNGLLLQVEAQSLECETHKITGSHRPRTVCMTTAEKEAAKEDSQRLFRTYSRGIGKPNG